MLTCSCAHLYLYSSVPVLTCICAHVFLCSPVPVLMCSCAHLYLCSPMPVLTCSCAHLYLCSRVPVLICACAHLCLCSHVSVLTCTCALLDSDGEWFPASVPHWDRGSLFSLNIVFIARLRVHGRQTDGWLLNWRKTLELVHPLHYLNHLPHP